jgi:hypothetical protein
MTDPIRDVFNIHTGQREPYDQILRSKYPAKAHAKRVADYIVDHGGDRKGVLYLESAKKQMNEVCSRMEIYSRDADPCAG